MAESSQRRVTQAFSSLLHLYQQRRYCPQDESGERWWEVVAEEVSAQMAKPLLFRKPEDSFEEARGLLIVYECLCWYLREEGLGHDEGEGDEGEGFVLPMPPIFPSSLSQKKGETQERGSSMTHSFDDTVPSLGSSFDFSLKVCLSFLSNLIIFFSPSNLL